MDSEINYLIGDATQPKITDNKIIVHICNDIGAWGKGFVMAISKRWKEPEKEYRNWFKNQGNFSLGQIQFIKVEDDIWIANLIGQHKINKDENGNAPIRYDAIKVGLNKVVEFAKENTATVHMPRIGCGLAGGTWDKIEPILKETLLKNEVATYVYDIA
jgi:O-acetyl-ADP-ribose deacetylase (regulator of RNase III)